ELVGQDRLLEALGVEGRVGLAPRAGSQLGPGAEGRGAWQSLDPTPRAPGPAQSPILAAPNQGYANRDRPDGRLPATRIPCPAWSGRGRRAAGLRGRPRGGRAGGRGGRGGAAPPPAPAWVWPAWPCSAPSAPPPPSPARAPPPSTPSRRWPAPWRESWPSPP